MTKIRFTPRWPGPIQGHAINLVKRWFPALCSEYEFEDLLQEAYIVYMKCKQAYPHIDNPAWFMAMFSRSLHNKLINLAARSGRYISTEDMSPDDEPATNTDEGFLRMVLQELPDEIKDLIRTVTDGTEQKGRAALRKLLAAYPV